MNFQALLFCQDQKIARITTQLLNELDFSVESINEPFTAVKKLMGQHFDAVVVDCNNEQNASLLFKGARNSSLNQSSLAVAVVEGQAGVANAFRIGANLVLTKPINIEQAKGTLRVARGLLKKGGEAAKATAPAAPAGPTSQVAPSAAKTATPAASGSMPASEGGSAPVTIPAPVNPVNGGITAQAMNGSAHVLEVDTQSSEPRGDILLDALDEYSPSGTAHRDAKPGITAAVSASRAVKATSAPAKLSMFRSGGAASAPAPAKEAAKLEVESIGEAAPDTKRDKTPETPALATSSGHPEAPRLFAQRSAAPFAGVDVTEARRGGQPGKLMIVAIIALALAAAAYLGYTKLLKRSPSAGRPSTAPQTPRVMPSTMNNSPAVLVATVAAAIPKGSAAVEPPATIKQESTLTAHKSEGAKASKREPEVVVTKIAPEPRLVKANPTPSGGKGSKDPEEEAPSVSAPGDDSAIANIVSSAPLSVPVAAPPPQMLKVSQGVTQGLLLKRVQPVYPYQALQMRVAGPVQLLATINKAGSISGVKVLSGDPLLSRAAVEAVSRWKYKPYTLDGEPVDIQTQITIRFKLP